MTESDDAVVIHDATRLGAGVDAAWFRGELADRRGGRGAVARVETRAGAAVLRRYRRGGAFARLLGDRYLYLGRERTRPFREFRLMAWAAAAGLPVPPPLAARYWRHGAWYRGELLVLAVPAAATLAERLAAGAAPPDWHAIGVAIGRLHAAGIWHADLNAHNVLLDRRDAVWLIDFDRGRRRRPGRGWQQANLARLARSLAKLDAPASVPGFARCWQALRDAHAGVLRAASAGSA